MALKVCKNCFLGKLVCDMFVNFISVENLSKWPAYLWHAGEKKTMAKIQEVHGCMRFTDKNVCSKYSQHAQNILRGLTFDHFGTPKMLQSMGTLVQVEC